MNTDPGSRRSENSSRISCPSTFKLTLLSETSLSKRLGAEVGFVCRRLRQQWPELKEHPAGVITGELKLLAGAVTRTLRRPQTALGLVTSVFIVTTVTVMVVVMERRVANQNHDNESDGFELVATMRFASDPTDVRDSAAGVGTDGKGRVGFAKDKGEGSRPEPARARGGGGGGSDSRLPSSQGRIPLPSIIPAPIPTAAVRLPQALPVAGIDLDPALWRKLDYSTYGDPRAKSVTPSNGPGEGGGVGTGKGTGIGEGEGDGVGPGKDGNMGGGGKDLGGRGSGGGPGCSVPGCIGTVRIYKSPEVNTRPRVISKPEPQYTEQARRDGLTGTVVLRVVFSSSGEVTNIQAVQKLGGGLTEKAIAAARRIRFVPATRDGHAVSMYMQLEYNFNLY